MNFELTSDAPAVEMKKPKAEVVKLCKNCKWYHPYRDTITNRVHPSKKGYCHWPIPTGIWPLAINPSITRSPMWGDTSASKCVAWEKK